MPRIVVAIEYDWPDDPYWLNPDNVRHCLENACSKTGFEVTWAPGGNPWQEFHIKSRPNVRMLRLEI